MTPSDDLVVNPVEVLRRLTPTDVSRPPWRGWVTTVHQGKADPGGSAHVLTTLNALCVAIDRVANQAGIQDVNLTEALASDLRASNASIGELASQLQKPTVISLRNLVDGSCPHITLNQLHDLIAQCDDLIELLQSVTDESAALAASAAQALTQVSSDLHIAEATQVLFVDPVAFTERNRGLVAYGLTLQREGATREAMLLLAISVALLGLLPPLALPAAAVSITLALAGRVSDRERRPPGASRELPAPDDRQ
jgi:hypothetical protein